MSWKVKALLEKWEARGLSLVDEAKEKGEDVVEGALDDLVEWAEESAAGTPAPYDDMLVGVFKSAVPSLKQKIDFDKDGD